MVRNLRRRSARRRLFDAPRARASSRSRAARINPPATSLLDGTGPTTGRVTSFMPLMLSLFINPEKSKPFFLAGASGMTAARACSTLASEKVIGGLTPVSRASTSAFNGPRSPAAGLTCQLKAGASPALSLAV